jgi:hypothetical protein
VIENLTKKKPRKIVWRTQTKRIRENPLRRHPENPVDAFSQLLLFPSQFSIIPPLKISPKAMEKPEISWVLSEAFYPKFRINRGVRDSWPNLAV